MFRYIKLARLVQKGLCTLEGWEDSVGAEGAQAGPLEVACGCGVWLGMP